MKYIWLAAIFCGTLPLSAYSAGQCDIKFPFKNVAQRVGDSKREFISQPEKMNADAFDDYLFIDKNSCSSKGCNNYFYVSTGLSRCYVFGGEFFGFVTRREGEKSGQVFNLRIGKGFARVLKLDPKTNTFSVAP